MQAHLVKLGLLSLAGSPDTPKITLRKGAKAEPGTEMDTLLRNVLGDPDEAEDAETAEEQVEARERADETDKAMRFPSKTTREVLYCRWMDVPSSPVVGRRTA